MTIEERKMLRKRTAQALRLLGHFPGFPVEVRRPCEYCGCLLWARVEGGRWPGKCARCLHCMPPLEMRLEHPEMMQIVEEHWKESYETTSR